MIAIHDTTLGPATGGCCMEQYQSEVAADRLAEQRIRTMKEVKKCGRDLKLAILMGKDL